MPDKINVRSDAFENGGQIPWEYGRDGEDLSPQLSWDAKPGIKSWALIVDDPDAPSGNFVHWVLFDLPGDVTSLPPGATRTKDRLHGAVEGKNSAGEIGYTGPYPPSGTHRYFFRLYGLDSTLGLTRGASKEQVMAEIGKHNKLAQGEIMGEFSRETSKAVKTGGSTQAG